MRRRLLWITLVFALVAPTVLRADNIAYNVNQTVGPFGMTGTITTDGVIGTLSSTDIIAWDLTLNSSPAIMLKTDNSSATLVGSSLSATAGQLTFDFTSGSFSYLKFNDPAAVSWWDVVSQPPSLGYMAIAELTGLSGEHFSYVQGTQVIAYGGVPVSTPEPGTIGLMLIGLGLLGLMMVMRNRISLGHQQAT
jgi:hypothetical protein